MTRARPSRLPVALFAAIALALFASNAIARADGEAGLVVDFGNGDIATYCIGFEGDDISGSQLIARAGLDVNQFNGLVCSLNGTGCQHSGSFESCTCECKPGGGSCTYWSFYNQRYGGSWIYSASGYQLAHSKDGDMQAWRWASGGPGSTSPPGNYTFEQVCGHAPRGGVEPPTATLVPPTATLEPPTATTPPNPATSTSTSTSTSSAAAPPSATSTRTSTSVPGTTPAGTPLVTIDAAASAAASATEGTTEAGSPSASPSPAASPSPGSNNQTDASATVPGGSPTAAATVPSAENDDDSGGSNTGNLIAFAAIAGLLVAAIGVAVMRGRAR